MFETSRRLWVVHISNHPDIAARAQREGFICIGWTAAGDLNPFNTREKMKAALRRSFPDSSDGTIRASYGQVFRFAHEMEVGDAVVYPIKGSRDLMIGQIAGAYRWAADDAQLRDNDYCNIRKVTWLKTVPRIVFSPSAVHSFNAFSSVSSSDDWLDEVNTVLKGEKVATVKIEPGNPPKPSIPTDDVGLDRINLAEQATEETEDFLLRQWSRTSQEFEEVVAGVFRAMGYTAQVQARTHDLGVDVLAHPDPLGLEPSLLKIQAKSVTGTVGAPAVKQLRGLLNSGEKGVLISLGGFSVDARHVQQNDGDLVLLDGSRFVELFLEFYDRLEPEIRHQFPLKRVYVSAG